MSKRIYQYPEVTELQEGDVMLIDKEGNESAKSILTSKVAPSLMSKTITERGTYKASDDGVRGYNEVDVDIPYTDIHVATGAIATFEGEDLPLKSLTVSIEPVQEGSGDPSPTNVRPISGWTEEVIKNTGVNLIGGDLFANAVKNAMPSATIDETEKTVSFTSSAALDNYIVVDDRTYGDYYIPFKENTSYTFVLVGYNSKSTADASNLRIYYTDGTNTTLSFDSTSATKQTKIYTTPASKTVNRLSKTNQDGTTVLYYDECGIFEGTITAEEYEPYAGTTTTIPFVDGQGQSVEVFGGSVDVTGGESTIVGKKFLLAPTASQISTVTNRSCMFSVPETANGFTVAVTNLLCNKLKPSNYSTEEDNHIHFANANILTIYTSEDVGTTKDDWIQWFTDMQIEVYYKVETPTTFYTQPTSINSLDGENNAFASTGDVDVEYQTVWVRPTE